MILQSRFARRSLLAVVVLSLTCLATSGEPAAIEKPFIVQPFWVGKTMDRESLLFLRYAPTEEPRANLYFTPQKLLTLKSASGEVTFEEGKDFAWKPGSRTITLPKG